MEPSLALARPGLDPRTRVLALTIAAIWPADWRRFGAIATAARAIVPRAELEETLLQATLFYGFPRTVTAFEQLAAAWPATVPPAGGDVAPELRLEQGRALFAAIYGRNDAVVRQRLASFHAAFHDFVLEAAYGRILSRPGLDPRTRELLAVTALAAMAQIPQLIAHARGAMTFGAGRHQVGEALWCALGDDTAVAELLQRIGSAA